PTGKLHLGHYVGSLRERVRLQNSGDFDKIFIMIADAQALTDHADNPAKVRESVFNVALDYLAVGLDPKKSTLFIQSQVAELFELTAYYLNVVTVSRLERNPTVKNEIAQKGFETSIPAGFLCYPVSQAADITAFDANIVPVGEDQIPMIEQTREIVRKINDIYGEVLVEPEVLLPQNQVCRRLPGIDGKAKMSKTLGNCIYLSDDSATVAAKIKEMYTDPLHIKVSDPGHIEGNVVFTYLDAFCDDKKTVADMKEHYQRGGLGDVKVKKFLLEVLEETLKPIRERRAEYESQPDEVVKILRAGTAVAREKAAEVLARLKAAMKINYFA
ncbi:MAG: tryptophan--tRNA ligase, partial [Selenomonadaceae bacterium]|nr:tryptophan--tRNA ligase [Selenomonadaceae bacterium]